MEMTKNSVNGIFNSYNQKFPVSQQNIGSSLAKTQLLF